MRLTKEEFCSAVDEFERMCKEERDLLTALDIGSEWKPGQWINTYYDFLNDMCDFDKNYITVIDKTWLDYYCFDLDFGRKWHYGRISVNGNDIPCRNSEELWNLITRESAE